MKDKIEKWTTTVTGELTSLVPIAILAVAAFNISDMTQVIMRQAYDVIFIVLGLISAVASILYNVSAETFSKNIIGKISDIVCTVFPGLISMLAILNLT